MGSLLGKLSKEDMEFLKLHSQNKPTRYAVLQHHVKRRKWMMRCLAMVMCWLPAFAARFTICTLGGLVSSADQTDRQTFGL